MKHFQEAGSIRLSSTRYEFQNTKEINTAYPPLNINICLISENIFDYWYPHVLDLYDDSSLVLTSCFHLPRRASSSASSVPPSGLMTSSPSYPSNLRKHHITVYLKRQADTNRFSNIQGKILTTLTNNSPLTNRVSWEIKTRKRHKDKVEGRNGSTSRQKWRDAKCSACQGGSILNQVKTKLKLRFSSWQHVIWSLNCTFAYCPNHNMVISNVWTPRHLHAWAMPT
jgi:hypothetical protein